MERVVEVSGLKAVYGENVVLEDINFYAKKGDITVILGGSGCGKSTLLKHIVGLLEPAQGEVRIFEKNLRGMEEEEYDDILSRVGLLFQNGALFSSLTVGQNVAMPLNEHSGLPLPVIEQIVRMKLSQVGMAGTEGLYPSELSGGMKKRVALARAIALDPELLICDEPSAGLDPVIAAGLDRLILDIKGLMGISVIVVTHELKSIETITDRAVMLHEGRIIAEGSISELKANYLPVVSDFFERRPHGDIKKGMDILGKSD